MTQEMLLCSICQTPLGKADAMMVDAEISEGHPVFVCGEECKQIQESVNAARGLAEKRRMEVRAVKLGALLSAIVAFYPTRESGLYVPDDYLIQKRVLEDIKMVIRAWDQGTGGYY